MRPPSQPTPYIDARLLKNAAGVLAKHGYPHFAAAVRDIGEAIERRAAQSETGHEQEQER
jgi:hypothetical protein